MACFRLVTLRPLRPLFNVPRFLRRIADATVLCAFLPYLRVPLRRVPLRALVTMGASLLAARAVAAVRNRAASMPAALARAVLGGAAHAFELGSDEPFPRL